MMIRLVRPVREPEGTASLQTRRQQVAADDTAEQLFGERLSIAYPDVLPYQSLFAVFVLERQQESEHSRTREGMIARENQRISMRTSLEVLTFRSHHNNKYK